MLNIHFGIRHIITYTAPDRQGFHGEVYAAERNAKGRGLDMMPWKNTDGINATTVEIDTGDNNSEADAFVREFVQGCREDLTGVITHAEDGIPQ